MEFRTGGEVDFNMEGGYIFTKEGSTPPMTISQIEEVTRNLRGGFSEFGQAGNANDNLEANRAPWGANEEETEWNRRNCFYLVLADPVKQIEVIQHEPTEKQAKLISVLLAPVEVQLIEETEV